MKKWKRFIAACLSVTMIASTPLSTFANSSVSLEQFTPKEKKELNVDNKKVEVTDFEKILSQEAPYEYFSKQKNWQNILDSLEDEELFQMKELMKYAYIYETSAENRQSLDAYLFILEDWKKRDLPNDSEKQAKLIQEVLEKSKVYEVPYGDKKVVDLSTFVEYMQGFKEFDVLKYIEVFTGLEQAQNDDELKAAKAAFENFENEIYGFEEKREELKAEDKTANPEKAENSEILTSPAEDIEVPDKVPETATPYSVDGDTKWIPNVKQWKDAVPAQSIVVDTPFTLDNMASISISKDDYILGIFQPDGWNMPAIMYNGTINANEVKSLSDIVIKWNNIGHDKDNDRIDMEVTFSNIHVKGAPYSTTNPRLIARSTNTEIEALYGKYFLELGSEDCRLSTDVHVKYLKRGTNTLANGDYIGYFTDIDAPDYGEIYNTEYSEKTITGIGISDIYTSNTCFLDIHKENGEYRLESTKYDNNTLDSGFVMKTQPEFSFTVKVAAASTQILKQFNPGTITATAGPGGSISDEGTTSIPWKNDKDYTITPDKGYHIKDVIVDGKPQGAIPNYHFPPIAEEDHTIEAQFEPNTYTITYEGNGGTWKEQSSWSENVVYNTEYTTQSNFFERPGHTFIGWNEKPDGSGTDWTEYIGKPWKWTYDRDITLYAQWKPNTLTVNYYSNGADRIHDNPASGTNELITTQTFTYDEMDALISYDSLGISKDGYLPATHWGTSPNGGVFFEPYRLMTGKELALRAGTDISFGDSFVDLYAQWLPVTYHIQYKGNGATSGSEQTDTILQEDVLVHGGYEIKDNSNFTNFAAKGKKFRGWYISTTVDDISKIYTAGSKMTAEMLNDIHKAQVSQNLVEDSDTEKNILLYAVWDKAPEITIPDNFKDEFYEGTTVTRQDLLSGIVAKDDIDQDISDKIIITQIDYSSGKLNGSGKDKAYSQKWADGMPADAVLDTWFMKLDKNDSPVKHKITYQVKDSAGNVTTATKEVRVIYNEFPEIKAIDQRFYLGDAQNGFITEDVLLKNLIAVGTLSASDKEEGDLSSKLELVDFDPSVFTSMKKEGFVPVTYRVQDSMGPDGKGKETLKTVYVHIYAVRPGEDVKYVRFINKEYYEKNANLPLSSLTEQEIALYAVNGGLHPRSKWYSDPSYASVIKATFNKTSGDVYTYTKDDIEKMRDFVKTHGVGNAKETDGLNKFADTFMTGKYKK